jgi:hypothetical protein
VQLQHLTEAETHVARATELVFDQEMCVARFELYGHDSTLAVPSWKHFGSFKRNTSHTAITS